MTGNKHNPEGSSGDKGEPDPGPPPLAERRVRLLGAGDESPAKKAA